MDFGICYIKKYIYIAGGLCSLNMYEISKSSYVYDCELDKWTKLNKADFMTFDCYKCTLIPMFDNRYIYCIMKGFAVIYRLDTDKPFAE